MSIQINGTDVVDDNRKGIFQSANVGSFANPARPGSASTGDLIWSTTDNELQVWNGSAWETAVGSGTVISASGGSEFTPGNGYKLHIFTGPGTFTLSNGPAQVEYAIVAGGGGGGSIGRIFAQSGFPSPPQGPGGAGGGGGLLISSSTFAPGNYSVQVGGGGAGGPASPGPGFAWPTDAGPGSNGGNSSISGPSGTFTAIGGGGGGGIINPQPSTPARYQPGLPGGSGGGGFNSGGSGTPGQGFPGEAFTSHANGGGAGFPGFRSYPISPTTLNECTGVGYSIDGWGIPSSYGTSATPNLSPQRAEGRFFAGGGGYYIPHSPVSIRAGGGAINQPTQGTGGAGVSGSTNTGGGGSGARGSASTFYPYGQTVAGPATGAGGSGGSGIVIIRYRTIQ